MDTIEEYRNQIYLSIKSTVEKEICIKQEKIFKDYLEKKKNDFHSLYRNKLSQIDTIIENFSSNLAEYDDNVYEKLLRENNQLRTEMLDMHKEMKKIKREKKEIKIALTTEIVSIKKEQEKIFQNIYLLENKMNDFIDLKKNAEKSLNDLKIKEIQTNKEITELKTSLTDCVYLFQEQKNKLMKIKSEVVEEIQLKNNNHFTNLVEKTKEKIMQIEEKINKNDEKIQDISTKMPNSSLFSSTTILEKIPIVSSQIKINEKNEKNEKNEENKNENKDEKVKIEEKIDQQIISNKNVQEDNLILGERKENDENKYSKKKFSLEENIDDIRWEIRKEVDVYSLSDEEVLQYYILKKQKQYCRSDYYYDDEYDYYSD